MKQTWDIENVTSPERQEERGGGEGEGGGGFQRPYTAVRGLAEAYSRGYPALDKVYIVYRLLVQFDIQSSACIHPTVLTIKWPFRQQLTWPTLINRSAAGIVSARPDTIAGCAEYCR